MLPPIVIRHVAVILLDAKEPPAEDVVLDVKPSNQIQVEEHADASLMHHIQIALQSKALDFFEH